MKGACFILIVICQMDQPVAATPDHAVTVAERFMGSNSSGFALLRTETDNMSSYYSSRISTWLDEISKGAGGRESIKSTLLLDVTHSVNVDHTDPNTSPAVTETINSQDPSMKLAAVLQRYSGQMRSSWTPEQFLKLEIHPIGGVRFNRKVELVHGTYVQEKLFGGRHAVESWKLEEVTEDTDCIYLKLSVGNDSGPESRIVCVPPETTKQQRDQASAQPVYLSVGKFEAREEAAQVARTIMIKAHEKKVGGTFELEIWSSEDGSLKINYVLVERFSTERIAGGGIPAIEKSLEIRLTPMSSERFIEKFLLPN